MMNVMKSLLAASCVMTLAAGCVRQDATPTSEIDKALPTSAQVKINLPQSGQTRTIGALAT